MQYIKIITLLFFSIFIGCSSEKNTKKNLSKSKKTIIPKFNADSAYHFVKTQVDFGPRALSSDGWEKCAIYLEKKLSSYCNNVSIQESKITTYDSKNHTLKNIIASFSPTKKNRIALFAHWDTRPIADHDIKNQLF